MNLPSSRHLSHDYEAYRGLSLRELVRLVLVITPLISLLSSLIGACLGFPLACGCLGFLTGFITAITICPTYLARLKAGKPYGYLTKRMRLYLSPFCAKGSPYLHYQGTWQKSNLIGTRYV